MRMAKRYKASEILEMLNQQWLNATEIKKLASVGYGNALSIKNQIVEEIHKDDPNYYLPNGLLPTQKVIEYLHIDIKYLEKLAKIQIEK